MGRDYAPRGARPRPPKRSTGGLPGWVWLVAGLSLGLAVAALVYIARPTAAPAASPAEDARSKPAVREKSGALTLPPQEKPRFTFYELLPNQEVVVPREEPSPGSGKSAPKPPPSDGTYLIQVASYRSQGDAERQKASLALVGVESRIETVTIDGRDTYYRVRVGPVQGAAQAHSTMVRLEENGVSALLVKVQ